MAFEFNACMCRRAVPLKEGESFGTLNSWEAIVAERGRKTSTCVELQLVVTTKNVYKHIPSSRRNTRHASHAYDSLASTAASSSGHLQHLLLDGAAAATGAGAYQIPSPYRCQPLKEAFVVYILLSPP